MSIAAAEQATHAFLRACRLDVEVRKPGNVSVHSPGHAMRADQFIASAAAAAVPLCRPGARVGARIEAAVEASWAAAGCNTNLGIVLLCAPIAAAVERTGPSPGAAQLQAALAAVLDELDIDDARAAFRAIARANPGGLGDAGEQDVRAAPSVDLRAAMALAADRDSIARQYACGFVDLFDVLHACAPAVSPSLPAWVLRIYLDCLSRWPDSHIVRKHGMTVAHTVMSAAQRWRDPPAPPADLALASWDEALKAERINPGTSADLTVAVVMLAGLLTPPP